MVSLAEPLERIAQLCRSSPVGKLLPEALYVHRSALSCLDPALQALEQQARAYTPWAQQATLVKFSLTQPKLSYLFYPEFDTEAHPALQLSIRVDLAIGEAAERDYRQTDNPPVLHRKETFVAPDYPLYATFQHLTQQEAALGLLKRPAAIGTAQGWQQRLAQHRCRLVEHALVCPLTQAQPVALKRTPPKIERHKAAIVRSQASKPIRLAVEAGLFEPGAIFFDYGCGHGADIEYIRRLGYDSQGWDPHFRAEVAHQPADIVNLGYVINVIEDRAERREALLNAWQLTRKLLVVAAQVLIDDSIRGMIAYGDGIITSRNTFQKYYEQEELKAYIDQVLGVDAIPAALGIYFVFRDEAQAEAFRASRFRSRATAPRIRLRVSQFEEYRDLLQPLMDFYTERGRLPTGEELDTAALGPLQAEFGSLKRAFRVILQATDAGEWDAIAHRRRQDLMVYLALSHFGKRPRFRDLLPANQADIKALFGSYQQACTAADLMLISLGRPEVIAERCRQSPIGQQRPSSLWVHVSALSALDPLLRLYEGCASRTIGRPEEATVVKFHLNRPKLTYLFCPDFDADPHPALHTSMQIDLRDLQVRYRDYDPEENPPLLHQKDQLVTPDYPHYQKFAKLSQQEQTWGLLDDLTAIYDRQGWNRCLAERCAELQGHRVVWRKDADPYRVKLLKAARRQRL
jgi:DNA phosphorothioation-associated putative methyltransferase